MQERYARRDVVEEREGIEKTFGFLGNVLKNSGVFRNECAGVMVEKKIKGITFQELFDRGEKGDGIENWDKLRDNATKFLKQVLKFNEKYALLWHRFDSDNIMLEVDEEGDLTGGIKIIDLNFTEKCFEGVRKKLTEKMKDTVVAPLLDYFEIDKEEVYKDEIKGEGN